MLCTDCKQKPTCSTPCAKLNKYLKDNGIYSADWIRPKRSGHKRGDGHGSYTEVPFSALNTDDKKIFKHKYGDFSEI